MDESQIAGPKVSVFIGSIVHKPRTKLLQSQFGIIPVTQALTASSDPDFADVLWLKREMPLRIHDPHVEARKRGSTTDDLRGRVDFKDLGNHAGLPQSEGTLVDRNDVAAAE